MDKHATVWHGVECFSGVTNTWINSFVCFTATYLFAYILDLSHCVTPLILYVHTIASFFSNLNEETLE